MKTSGMPHLMGRDGKLVPLERVALAAGSQGTFSEDHLQEVLFKNPGLLPSAEIDSAYEGLVPLCRELQTSAGYVDLLCMTPQGKLAIVETKLWRNPQARREVVAQILDYAKDMVRWSYSDLEREVIKVSGEDKRTLYERVGGSGHALSEASFCDQVSRQLRTGQFLLLIVGDGIREGVGDLTDFLDRFGSMQFSFGLIEVGVFQMPDGSKLFSAAVVAKTALIPRTVVVLQTPVGPVVADEIDTPHGSDTPEAVDPEKSRHDTLRFEFWERLRRSLKLDDASQPMANATHSTNLYFSMPPSNSDAWVAAFLSKSSARAGVYLRFKAKSGFADEAWKALEADKPRILADLGSDVVWSSEERSVAVRRLLHDLEDPAHQDELVAYFADKLNRFIRTFRPRLERIARQLGPS